MYLSIILIVITTLISWQGIKKEYLTDKYSFNIHRVLVNKEYVRFISSGFFHVNWLHLIINMVVLFMIGNGLEMNIGSFPFLLIYFTSLVGGNLLALMIHKHRPLYTSVGASGAISGLVFATIALIPGMRIWFLPGWLFGVAYVIYTIYAIRSQRTDVGHAAHLGGGLIGMLAAVMMFPSVLQTNVLPILLILLPGVALVLIMIYRPDLMLIDKKTQKRYLNYEDRYNMSKADQKKEVDRILEKINQKGIDSLSARERQLLEKYSKS